MSHVPCDAIIPVSLPPPTQTERLTSPFGYLMALIGFPFAPLLLLEKRSAFCLHHAKVATLLATAQFFLAIASQQVDPSSSISAALILPLRWLLWGITLFELTRALRGKTDGPLSHLARLLLPIQLPSAPAHQLAYTASAPRRIEARGEDGQL